jgi:iron complex outermembrane receptor protein
VIVNTDHVFSNVGVRGISGGIRSASRHIKVMIDGQPVAFRPDAANLLGPELIPIEAIERIEVVRGPASSLYGVNAFLGLVNIITQKPKTGDDLSLPAALATGELQYNGRAASYGAGALTQYGDERLSLLLAASLKMEDRSGLELPPSSPDAANYSAHAKSEGDVARPASVYGTIALDLARYGMLKLAGSFQELNAAGEWQDSGVLSHATRVHLRNGFLRGDYELAIDFVTARTFFVWSSGGPGEDDLIQPTLLGQDTPYALRRSFGFNAITTGAEATCKFWRSSVIAGLEYDVDWEDLRQNVLVLDQDTQVPSGDDFGVLQQNNVGVYLQALFNEIESLSLSGNVRYDRHNLYGDAFNYRVAVAWRISEHFFAKAISGSSFRAPTPEQLYGAPDKPGGIQGALSSSEPTTLQAQTALMHELLLGYANPYFQVTMNGYVATVAHRIEYLRRQGDLQAANLSDSLTVGGELTALARYRKDAEGLSVSLGGSLMLQYTEFALGKNLTPREAELLSFNELFPNWAVKWMLDVAIPQWFLRFHAHMVICGPRHESQSNQSIGRPLVGDPLRMLPLSYPLQLTLSTHNIRLLGDRETALQMIFADALQSASVEPGFDGVNIPSLGRRLLWVLRQEF